MTLVLVDDFWRAESTAERSKLRAEIRMSTREYGLSSFSRRQLHWQIRSPRPSGHRHRPRAGATRG